ncbi:hypothetical protein GJ744_008699 [Endocarpon pusillum]|uniref:N-acetyltransferase domain-containing protein n=1 Tax=Endocarpon pusillum TaxID=364733 RepID=A0A8H7AKV5_9EURO|nr:hypothetical protein GJ744_008699 [Endocarpon pusillum]
MLQDALARDSNSQRENSRPEADTNPGEQKLDGEDFNVINHEDVEDIDDEEDETEPASYHSGLAGLLGGRMMQRGRKTPGEFDHLHPFTQVLSISNVDDCVKLEAEAFPANERCSKEKFIYRLASCPELSLGLISRPTLADVKANKNLSPKHRLIAHISATRTPSRTVNDASMGFPPDWKTRRSSLPIAGEVEPQGHQEQGGTIALHSLAVVKEHQRKGLGTILLKAYIERIKSAKIAERISLLAHGNLVKFYERFGFVDEGLSEVTYAGGRWNSMVLEFSEQMDD